MSFSRYTDDDLINRGRSFGTAFAVNEIRRQVRLGNLSVRSEFLKDDERLDIVASRVYGDGNLWWVIAAASNIGWGLQLSAGTRLVIPTDISEIEELVT